MQTGLSEEEKEACYKEEYDNAVFQILENIKMQNPEAYWDIIIEALYKHFERENRAKRSKEEIFSELDQLETEETEYFETSGSVQDGLKAEVKVAWQEVEFENYVTLLKKTRACFWHGVACIVISNISKHKGEFYCMSCMSRSDKEKVVNWTCCINWCTTILVYSGEKLVQIVCILWCIICVL